MSSETEVSKFSAAAPARHYTKPKAVGSTTTTTIGQSRRRTGQSFANNCEVVSAGRDGDRVREEKHYASVVEHWKSSVRELVVAVGPSGILQLPVQGGSDNGEFCYLGNNVPERLEYLRNVDSGAASSTTEQSLSSGIYTLKSGDVLLEIQDQKVAGYTRRDVLAWLNHSCRCGNYVKITVAESGLLTTNLRQFLNTRFVKGSPDHDLQNTIRDNLYLRTVPCTTRPRRDGEVDGVDYSFLSLNEFLSLESSGNLLESGIYEGNHYGTPKPPRENHIHSLKGPGLTNGSAPSPSPSLASSLHIGGLSTEVFLPGAHPSSEGKRRRNRSNVEAMASKFGDLDERQSPAVSSVPSISNGGGGDKSKPGITDVFGISSGGQLELGSLPDNWEKAYTEEGEPYFINHTSGCSQWLDPRLARVQKKAIEDCDEDELPYGWEKIDDPQFGTYYIDHINRKTQYENPVLQARQAKEQQNEPPLPKRVFTKNPSELRGPLISTTLIKSPRGFGFTIVGGDEQSEEFLQIKSVIHNGPAFQNGMLMQGDVLVYIDDTCVLGYTHMDVVNVFQNIPVGEAVTLKVCRGYPLTFDVDDPHNEIVTTVAVTAPDVQSVGRADSEPSDGTANTTTDGLFYTNNERGPAEVLTVGIVKGLMGFGFTIADSANGQKVKKILDRPRCKNLMEGDIMLEIDSQDVRGLEHSHVVQYLKDCPQDLEAIITVQRGGILLPNHKSRPKSAMAKDADDSVDSKSDKLNQLYGSNMTVPGGPYRSKTPTCDVYGVREREVFPTRPKTPLIDTRNLTMSAAASESNGRPKTPASIGDLSIRDNVRPATIGDTLDAANSIYQKVTAPAVPDRWTQQGGGGGGGMNNAQQQHQAELRKYHAQPEDNHYGYTMDQGAFVADRGVDTLNNRDDQFYRVPGDINQHYGSPVDSKARDDYYGSRNDCIINNNNNIHQNAVGSNQRSATMLNSGLIVSDGDCYATATSAGGGGAAGRYYEGATTAGSSYGNFYNNPHQSSVSNGGTYSTRNTHFDSELTYGVSYGETLRKEGTSFEHEQPSPLSQSARIPYLERPNANSWHNGSLYQRMLLPVSHVPECIESAMTLYRQESGFGFRIIGGTEEGSQVSIGHIVPGGAADLDGRLRSGDEITTVDGISVLHTSHHHVVQLMGSAAASGRVTLGVRRRIQHSDAAYVKPPESLYPYDVNVVRRENEGFGFVIISSITKAGSTIGRIIDNSPAQRCNRLHVGDRILAVNGIDILNLHHGDIVNLIKDSGFTVTLTIGAPQDDSSSTASTSQREEITLDDDQYIAVELLKGTRGFGFSIRGGKEFHNMPLFVLRIAESGPAAQDGRLQIGDQIIQINGINTKNMTHSDAIEIIKHGGSLVRLLVKRGNRSIHPKDRYTITQNFSTASLGEFMMPPFTSKIGGPIGQSSPQVALTSDPNAYTWEYERGPVLQSRT